MKLFKVDYHTPIGYTPDSYIKKLCEDGIKTRYREITGEIEDRLKYELNAIGSYQFANYFLMCWDFVNFAKKETCIMFGPGHGAQTGSLVLYALGITNIDPLEYGLLFERFIDTAETIWLSVESRDDHYSEIIKRYKERQCETISDSLQHRKKDQRKHLNDKETTLGLWEVQELNTIKEDLYRIKNTRGIDLDINKIPLDHEKTYAILSRGEIDTLFLTNDQESQNILQEWQPKNIREIAAAISLSRTGPISKGMDQEFRERKRQGKWLIYTHPILEKILKETFGMIIYQEQIMQIANEMAGFSMSKANDLRIVLGHLKFEQIRKYRDDFIQGAIENGIEEAIACKTFDQIEEYSQFSFNKSHAIACAMIVYQMAYLKANYPKEFQEASEGTQNHKNSYETD